MASVGAILDFLAESTLKTGLPVPIPMEEIYSWAIPMNLPCRGRVYLYTGALYQLMPYIERLGRILERLEGSKSASTLLRLGRVLITVPRFTRTLLSPESMDIERSRGILARITRLLKASGVEIAYPYEADLYSGVLLYDMGLDEAFAEVANRVYHTLKKLGAEEIVTVDPHTTHVMKSVYPEYVDGYDLRVRNYLEVVAEAVEEGRVRLKGTVAEAAIHDPCFYARYEGIIEEPRRILEAAGVRIREPRRSRENTYCCGGPAESISPRLAARIARTRLEELARLSSVVVVMCPICYANLSRANTLRLRIVDIAEAVEPVEV